MGRRVSKRKLSGRNRRLTRRQRRRLIRKRRRALLRFVVVFIFGLIAFGVFGFVRGCSPVEEVREEGVMGPFLPEDAVKIEGIAWLFSEQETVHPVGRIRNQWVRIIEEDGNWYRVESIHGVNWMRRNFTPSPVEIEELLERYGSSLAVHFENLETGFVFHSNGGQDFYSASIMKAVHALYIYQQAERGFIDLDSEHVYTYPDATHGSGVIYPDIPVGTSFPLHELLRLNVSESDNVASNMLTRVIGLEGYRTFVSGLGVAQEFRGYRVMNHALTARDAGIFAREIFNYLESDGRYSQDFKNHLLNNQFPFIVSDYPVASKTGWEPPYAWHDMAIVYAESPFTLVILTARSGWTERDYEEFAEISMAFQEFNRKWFVE